MTDPQCYPESLKSKNKQLLLAEQNRVAAELVAKRDVSPLAYNPHAKQLTVPKVGSSPTFVIRLRASDCHNKRLIFGALNAAWYRYFMTEDFTDNRKQKFVFANFLWEFLKEHTITKANRANIFKDFEAWRVKDCNVKTQSTGLKWLNLCIQSALGLDAFASTLSQSDIDYLQRLSETSSAPPDDVDAVNLNHWFSQHTWLRRDDVGIGHELYTRLSSPKMLMDSFRVTVENILLHIQNCKDTLLDLFQFSQLSPCVFPNLRALDNANETKNESKVRVLKAKELTFSILCDAITKLDVRPEKLNSALELAVFSNCPAQFRADTLDRLNSSKPLSYAVKKQGKSIFRYTSSLNSGLFDCDFLSDLAAAAMAPQGEIKRMPVCKAEQLLFSWLMAYQTVQKSDIPKLTLSDFKFLRRVNGQITHIECEYFKSRSNSIHQVRTLPTKDPMGRAILRYLTDVTALNERHIPLTVPYRPQSLGPGTLVGRLMLLSDETSISNELMTRFQEQRVTPVFMNAMLALIRNGVHPRNRRSKQKVYETVTVDAFFGCSQVKTSAVYAKAVAFDPTTLLNPRSHTDNTERANYLCKNNEDWQNRCGRITRAVMSDIATNVFRSSNADKACFESEFSNAIEAIKQRSEETLLRMKLVTEKASGRVDELGVNRSSQPVEGILPDALYLEDSPETVLKLTHYLTELERKHKALLKVAPEFLFATALPTAEWIECLFDNKRFSKESLEKGLVLYNNYANILPPQFTAQIT